MADTRGWRDNKKLRRALEDVSIDLECLADYGGMSDGAKAVVMSALKDVNAALSAPPEDDK